MIGREGVTHVECLLHNLESPYSVIATVATVTQRIPIGALHALFDSDETVRQPLLCYLSVFMTHMIAITSSAGDAHIRQKLACWILRTLDRTDTMVLAVTQELIARRLNIRRPSVTMALHELEGDRLIRNTRGELVVLDRTALISIAGSAYGEAEANYERLLGFPHVTPALAWCSPNSRINNTNG